MSAPEGTSEGFRPAARAALYALSFGHGSADLCSGAVSALLPYLAKERHYSLGAAGLFVLAASVGAGLLQPLFGHQGDRTGARWLVPVGLLLGGAGIAVVGLVNSKPVSLGAVAVASIGVAAFHPEGARWARAAAGTRVVSGMSVFSVGGSTGYALAPLLVIVAALPFGLRGTPVLALLPAAAAAIVATQVRRLSARVTGQLRSRRGAEERDRSEWSPFARLALMNGVGSAMVSGLMAFVPLFLVKRRGASPISADVMLTVLLVAAAAGTLLGGRAADRIGRRLVLIVPPLVLIPCIAMLPSLGYAAMLPLVFVIGLAMNAGLATIIVMAQEYLPDRIGLAAGVIVGLAVSMGGVAAWLLGLLGDAVGPAAMLYVIAGLPAPVFALALSLRRPAAASPDTIWSRALRESFGR